MKIMLLAINFNKKYENILSIIVINLYVIVMIVKDVEFKEVFRCLIKNKINLFWKCNLFHKFYGAE